MLDRTGGTGTGHVAIGATVDFRWGGVACNAFGRQAEWYWSFHNLGDVTAFKKGPN